MMSRISSEALLRAWVGRAWVGLAWVGCRMDKALSIPHLYPGIVVFLHLWIWNLGSITRLFSKIRHFSRYRRGNNRMIALVAKRMMISKEFAFIPREQWWGESNRVEPWDLQLHSRLFLLQISKWNFKNHRPSLSIQSTLTMALQSLLSLLHTTRAPQQTWQMW